MLNWIVVKIRQVPSYQKQWNNPTSANKAIHTKFRNKYIYLIKLWRKKYYHDKLSSICSSLKQTWSLIKSVISSKHSCYGPTAMKENKFNGFFTNIGRSLATKTPHSTVDHKSYLSGSFSDSFFASPTTPDEIINT